MPKTLDKNRTCRTIKDTCSKRHLDAVKISELLGVSEQTVYSWFSAKKMPSIDHLIELADILEVKLDDLIETHMFRYGKSPPVW